MLIFTNNTTNYLYVLVIQKPNHQMIVILHNSTMYLKMIIFTKYIV